MAKRNEANGRVPPLTAVYVAVPEAVSKQPQSLVLARDGWTVGRSIVLITLFIHSPLLLL